MNKMRVAFLTYGTSPIPATKGGAVENLIEDLLDENEKHYNFDFSVLSIYEEKAEKKSKEYLHSNFHFVKCPGIVDVFDKCVYWIAKYLLKKSNLISYRFIFRRLYVMSNYPKILLENDYDRIILVTNSTLFFILKNRKVAAKYKDKVIYYLHNEIRSLFKCEKEISSIRSLIGISQFVNDSFRKKVPRLKEEQCFILKNAVDTEKFSARNEAKIEQYNKKYGIGKNDFVVIFAGRLVDEKGAIETIKAVKKCDDENIKLLIVGAGFYSSDVIDKYTIELQKEAESIKDRIIFTGYIDYDDMPSVYQLGNVAVLPSIWEEPAGMTMVEALVSGLPLITTNSGGIPEYIPREYAVVLDRDDDLIDNISTAIMNKKLNGKFTNCQLEKYKEEMGLVKFFERFSNIIIDC
jgi:glycosyltransferase involved in cell wall biosynthesis